MTYTFSYTPGSRPVWEKVFTSSGGETFSVALVFENKEDREALSAAEAYTHMENFIQYVKDITADISVVQLSEPAPSSFWPVNGDYDEAEWAMQEIQKWWNWAYFNDAFSAEESA